MASQQSARQRVPLPVELRTAYKRAATADSRLLRGVFSDAVRACLKHRAKLSRGQKLPYLRAPKGLGYQLVDLDDGLLETVQSISTEDNVSVRSFLYHALVQFAPSAPPP